MESNPKRLEKPTAEDNKKMDTLVQGAKEFLASETVRPQMEVLGDSKHILDEELRKDVNLVMEKIGDAFENTKSAKEIFSIIPEKLKWEDEKTRAMMGVLEHALKEFYFDIIITSVDEKRKRINTNEEKEIILEIIKEDYSTEIMKEIEPLVDSYLQKASNILREKKGLER